MKISVISPVYNAANVLDKLVSRIENSITSLTNDYEIILINDASLDDKVWNCIKDICKRNKKVVGINLSRNFGQHYAITAGLDMSKGGWVVVMDCDLQDVPEEIPKLYEKAIQGYDAVLAQRIDRKDGIFKKSSSYLFYKILGFLSGYKQDNSVANFGVYSRNLIDSINSMRELIRFPTLVHWVGFKKIKVPVKHNSSIESKSNYGFRNSLKLAFDVIISNSQKPLRITVIASFNFSHCFYYWLYYIFLQAYFYGFKVSGFASLIISIWFLSGIIIMPLELLAYTLVKRLNICEKSPYLHYKGQD